jgi:hypothetical protein
MPLHFETRDGLKESVSARRWREANKLAYYDVGMEFEQSIKPTKFTEQARSLYNFKPRSPKYLKRKVNGFVRRRGGQRYPVPNGGRLDLVYTGRLRAAIMQPHFPRVTPTRVTIRYATPRSDQGFDYVQMRPFRSNHPNLGQELLSVTAEQLRRLESIYHATVENEVKP